MQYVFTSKEHGSFTPNGRITVADTDAHNRALEAKEIEWLKTHPDKLFLYVSKKGDSWTITTWLGTVVSTQAEFSPRAYVGFGRYTYRRSVRCMIFGQRYTGWYMESSGNYCRLKRSVTKAS